MEKKHTYAAGAIVLVIAAVIGWPHLRWFQFTMDARDAIGDKQLGRFPSAEQMIAFRGTVTELAKKRGFTDLKIELNLRELAQGPTTFWFFVLDVRSGTHTFQNQRRIESRVDSDMAEALEEAGIGVHRDTSGG